MNTPTNPPSRFVEAPLEQMSVEQRALHAKLTEGPRGKVPTPYKIWLSNPALVTHLEPLGNYLVRGSSLTRREVEIAILAIARQMDSDFVLNAHTRIAGEAGLDRDIIDALRSGQPPPLTNAREQSVYEIISARRGGPGSISDEVFTRAVNTVGHAGIVDLAVLHGYYVSVAYTLDFYRVR